MTASSTTSATKIFRFCLCFFFTISTSGGQLTAGLFDGGNGMKKMQQMAKHIKAAAEAANSRINHERLQRFKVQDNNLTKATGALKYASAANRPLLNNAQAQTPQKSLAGAARAAGTAGAVNIDPFSREWRDIYLQHCAKSYANELCEKLFDWSYFDHWLGSATSFLEHGDVSMMQDIRRTLERAAKACNGVRKTKGTAAEDSCLWKSINEYFHRNNDPDRLHMWLVRLRPWFDVACGDGVTWTDCSAKFHSTVGEAFIRVYRKFAIPLQGLSIIFRSFIVECFNEMGASGRQNVQSCIVNRLNDYETKLSDPNLAALAFS